MDEGRRARRARERWQKQMLRRLEELDRLDREHGLGTYPTAATAKHRRPGPPLVPGGPALGSGRRSRGPVIPGLMIALIITALVMLRDPGATGARFNQLVDELTGDDGSYAFVVLNETRRRPITWDPCKSIHYTVNPKGAPPGWEDTVEEAVEEISEASGFDFEYDGTTSDRRFENRLTGTGESAPPVLIGWADAGEVPELEGPTAGIGGSSPVRRAGRSYFVTGIVVLDQRAFEDMHRTGRNQAERLILAHELGHVLGLDHVEDTGELMNPEYVGQRGFGDGDRKGFAILRDQPCE